MIQQLPIEQRRAVSRATLASQEASKTPSAAGRRLRITVVILLALAFIMLITGVAVLTQKKFTDLKDSGSKTEEKPGPTFNLVKREINLGQRSKEKRKLSRREGKCGTISIPFCQNMSYTTAQFPNHLNQNQEDAKAWIDAKDLTKLVQSGCSPDIGPLLCSFLAPPCNGPGRLVKPCKQLCKRATKACKAVLRRLRINLHPVMACRQLPRDRTPKCFDGSWKGDTSDCQQVPLKQCAKHIKRTSSWQAQFPNYFGHTKEEAIANLKLFDPIWPYAESEQSDCASTLAHFLCNMYAPQCAKSNSRIPPCKELCLSARSKCRSSFKQVRKESGFTWPKDIACKNFPPSGTAPCYMTTTPTTSTGRDVAPVTNAAPSSGKCQRITIPLCKTDLPYKMALFPNLFNQSRQRDAAIEVNQFSPLVMANCASDLPLFLCSLYAPPCMRHKEKVPPCRSLCSRVRIGCESLMNRFGFSWPKMMACERFPEASPTTLCLDKPNMKTSQPSLTATIRKEERCEAMTIPLCRSNDVPFKYNMTRIPNFFKHFSQSEAAQQVSQFLPLVKVDCSPDLSLFLCSLYSPPCIGPQKPCRELCNRVKTGCASVLEEFGVPWPEVLACEKFPLSSGDELCFQPTKVSATTTQTPATTTQILTLTDESKRPTRTEPFTGDKCEDLTISHCHVLPYNKTSFPNHLKHHSQEEAELEVNSFAPLVNVNCSQEFQSFVCFLYAPPCDGPRLPCKELCYRVREACLSLMQGFGFGWPDEIDCDRFPSSGNGTKCMDTRAVSQSTTVAPTMTDEQ